jgi:hypothetical protein
VKLFRAKTTPNGYWKDVNNQRQVMDRLAETFGIKRPEDWYTISTQQVIENGGRSVIRRYGMSLTQALSALYHLLRFIR